MKHLLLSLTILLSTMIGLSAQADPKDMCWQIGTEEIDAGILRLRAVHSIGNQHFVLSGVRELDGGLAYSLTGAAQYAADLYKVTLLETGNDENGFWSTSWSLDLDPEIFAGDARALTTLSDGTITAETFQAAFVNCRENNGTDGDG